MTGTVPTIDIRPSASCAGTFETDDILASLAAMLLHRGRVDPLIGQVVAALVAEGRRFASTDSGRRWISVLADSKLATNGWMLWNMLDLDRYVTGRDDDPGGDTPAAMIEDLLRRIGEIRLEELIRLVSDLAVQETEND